MKQLQNAETRWRKRKMTKKRLHEESNNETEYDLIEHLTHLAKERQVRGFQTKKGIYLAVDRGFDTKLNVKSYDRPEASLETYVKTCEKSLATAFGTCPTKGILVTSSQP